MSAPLSGLYQARMRIAGHGRKWTEKYFIGPQPNILTARSFAKYLPKFRCLILAAGFTVASAAVHRMDKHRDKKALITAPLGPLNLSTETGTPPVIETCNNVNTCINVSYETDDGDFDVRQFRGLRDGWTNDDAFTITVPGIDFGVALATVADGTDDVAGLTAGVAMSNWLRAVAQYSFYMQKDLSIPGQFNAVPWTAISIGAVSTRDTGNGGDGPRGRAAAA